MTAAHLLLNADGEIDTVHRLLAGAIDAEAGPHQAGDDIIILQALQTLMVVCYTGGRAELWPAFGAAIGRLGPHIPADLLLLSRTIADPARIRRPGTRRAGHRHKEPARGAGSLAHHDHQRRGRLRRPAAPAAGKLSCAWSATDGLEARSRCRSAR